MTRLSALVVDDDAVFRESLALLVSREGFEVRSARSISDAREQMAERAADLVLADLGLPDGDGIELLRDDRFANRCEFVVVTGNATTESAIAALREGALDYLTKPVDRVRLRSILAGVVRTREFKADIRNLRGELRELGRFGRMVGISPVMQTVYDLIARVAPSRASVFLFGESGTGKELAAETIHLLSGRRDRPFVAINCGAIAKTLVESELFGHVKGSFTGAGSDRRGYFEEADGGTLFLDEVGSMSPELQGSLLRVLESDSILRVGGSEAVPVNVRVIAATNRDPQRAVRDGSLREDLYHRLNVFPIVLPPLRDRSGDIELLADHFLDRVNQRDGSSKTWSPETRALLPTLSWPGNVRELRNYVERAAILADDSIGPGSLGQREPNSARVSRESPAMLGVAIGTRLEDAERRIILATLEMFQGDKRRTAEALGIGLKTLYTRLGIYRAEANGAPHDEFAASDLER